MQYRYEGRLGPLGPLPTGYHTGGRNGGGAASMAGRNEEKGANAAKGEVGEAVRNRA